MLNHFKPREVVSILISGNTIGSDQILRFVLRFFLNNGFIDAGHIHMEAEHSSLVAYSSVDET